MKFSGSNPKMFDDLARVAGGAINIFSGLQEQIRNDVRARVDEAANRMDLVSRDDLDQAKATINTLRTQIRTLEERLDKLEGKKPSKAAPAKQAAVKKAAAPKAAAKKTATNKSKARKK